MKRILIVDDEPEICDILQEFLSLKGYEVFTVLNGEDAISKLKEERPHIVLLDMLMAGMNGMEVLQRIKKIDRQVGVIITTGVKDEKIAKQAIKKGADDYITKPIDLNYLETSILVKISSD